MLPSPVPADPGWGEGLAWLDRDPVTAAEFEASLDRLCELDECYPTRKAAACMTQTAELAALFAVAA